MRKIFEYALGLFLVLTAVAYTPSKTFGEVQGAMFKIGVPLLYVMSQFLTPVRNIRQGWLNSIVGLVTILFLFWEPKAQLVAVQNLVVLYMAMVLFYLVVNYVEDFKVVIRALGVVVIINALMIVIQLLGLDPLCIGDEGLKNPYALGFFGFKYVLGAYMALVTPFFLLQKKWFLGALSFILCVTSLSWASIGICMFSILFGTYFLLKKKIWVGLVVLSFLLGGVIYQHVLYTPGNYVLTLRYKIKSRVDVESKFLLPLFSRPYTGYGLGTFQFIAPDLVNNKTGIYGTATDAWNDYLEKGIELGWFYLALLYCLIDTTWKRFWRYKDKKDVAFLGSSMFVFLLGSGFHNYINHFSLGALLVVLFAMFEVKLSQGRVG